MPLKLAEGIGEMKRDKQNDGKERGGKDSPTVTSMAGCHQLGNGLISPYCVFMCVHAHV